MAVALGRIASEDPEPFDRSALPFGLVERGAHSGSATTSADAGGSWEGRRMHRKAWVGFGAAFRRQMVCSTEGSPAREIWPASTKAVCRMNFEDMRRLGRRSGYCAQHG